MRIPVMPLSVPGRSKIFFLKYEEIFFIILSASAGKDVDISQH